MKFGVPSGAIDQLLAAIRSAQHDPARPRGPAARHGEHAWDHSGLVRALEVMAGGHDVRESSETGELLD
jgi:hypothetical protein